MTSSMLAGLRPVHPGTILRRDVLPALGVSTVAVAKALGISRQHLYDIMGARSRSPRPPRCALDAMVRTCGSTCRPVAI